jgi:hypothetical protein
MMFSSPHLSLIFFVTFIIKVSLSTTNNTLALSSISFYTSSHIASDDQYMNSIIEVPSLNSNLWSATNQTLAEKPFSNPPHIPGLEWVINVTTSINLEYINFTNSNGIATLPTGNGYLAIAHGLTFIQCAAHCSNSANCAAWASYQVLDDYLCQYYTSDYSLGPQSWPSGNVLFAQGARLINQIVTEDNIANGLRSGTWLGGLGTNGYEIRADGTFHLSTIRNQSPASEPWQGTVRDMVLAFSINGIANVVRLSNYSGIQGVDEIIYSDRVPISRFEFANLTLYAYSTLTPGYTNLSNTPAIIYTLHINCDLDSSPLNVTFALFAGLGFRNDWNGVSSKATIVQGIMNQSDCAAACIFDNTCLSWQWNNKTMSCLKDSSQIFQGANAAGYDSGHPGIFIVNRQEQPTTTTSSSRFPRQEQTTASIVFTTRNVSDSTIRGHNALGSQGLFTFPVYIDGDVQNISYGASSSSTAEALLATLSDQNPSNTLHTLSSSSSSSSSDLFAMVSSSLVNLMPGSNASISLIHAWYYPHFFWYRDTFDGTDNSVRYTKQFNSIYEVVDSLNLTKLTTNLLAWQNIYSGLPDPILSDAAFNLFAHVRSSMWFAKDEEYRQWESLEFTDFLNPTNGDERHLNYFTVTPAAMRSQLRTMVKYAHNSDGMFYCVSVSCANDAQFCSSDPCPPTDHPDDIAMFVIGLYELYSLANDTSIVDELYQAVVSGLLYYQLNYDSTLWSLPYSVHETYDAVPLTPTITGEGNLGTSLYNSLNYLTALNCIASLADYKNDTQTSNQARLMLNRSTKSILKNLWNGGSQLPSFIGDTLQKYQLFTEPTNGFTFHSSDGLHGQVLAYRLGFGDLLPRTYMQLHQKFVTDDLLEEFGLSFSKYSHQNWVMSDHSNTALRLRWNDITAWNTSLFQIQYWRNIRKESTRNTAVFMANTGMYALLNYYGYALFFYHTLGSFSGQVANLPNRSISFSPHFSAFSTSGIANIPVLLGGCLGTLSITPVQALLTFEFLGEDSASSLSFLSITICQHEFSNGPFEFKQQGDTVNFVLPSPCNTSLPSSANTLASNSYCKAIPAMNSSSLIWAQQPITQYLENVSLEDCLNYATLHYYCGYEYDINKTHCSLVPGIACYLVDIGPSPLNETIIERGYIHCDYSTSGYLPSININSSDVHFSYQVAFTNNAPIDSPVFSILLPNYDECIALAISQQSCGFLWAPHYLGTQLGSCGPQALDSGCCVLNPSAPGVCSSGSALDPSIWGIDVILGIFGTLQ